MLLTEKSKTAFRETVGNMSAWWRMNTPAGEQERERNGY
jgi:hypothetical protein